MTEINTIGPVLQFRGIDGKNYRVSVLLVRELNQPDPSADALLSPSAAIVASSQLAAIPFSLPRYHLWRLDLNVTLDVNPQIIRYEVAGVSGEFSVPAEGTSPRMSYVSCNGFSDPKLMKKVDDKFDRWRDLALRHNGSGYHLLLMGGDQVYTDEIWTQVKQLKAWTDLSIKARIDMDWNQALEAVVEDFFCDLYLTSWAQPEVKAVLQSIPSIMMWDDHDIFDGWGSYPEELHNCAVFTHIYQLAHRYFRLFQQQLAEGENHPAAIAPASSYSLGFRGLGNLNILVLDLRSERKPEPEQILSPQAWDAIYAWLDQEQTPGHLICLSSVPVSYLDLNLVEKLLGILPGEQELEDDLRDHWRSAPHQQERLRLIHRLFRYSELKRRRVTLVSGDVHVGAASAIESVKLPFRGNANVINQLVSTGVVHPVPPGIVRYLLESIGDKPEVIDRGITATMLQIAGKGRYLLGARNWLALEPDDKGRIWANWHLEGANHPLTKVIHPCDELEFY